MEWILPGIACATAVIIGYVVGTERQHRRHDRAWKLLHAHQEKLRAIAQKLGKRLASQDQREKVLERYEASLAEWAQKLKQQQPSSVTFDEHAASGPAAWVSPPAYTGPISEPAMPVSPLTHHHADGRVTGKVSGHAPVAGGRHSQARAPLAPLDELDTGIVVLEPIAPGGAR